MDLSSFVRRDISGIRKDILPLSGFGILSHALADEIAARNQAREGYFYTTDMEFLEEGEPEQQPMLPPVSRKPETVRMDMNILFKIVQESGENGKALPAGTRKMLERVRTILKANPQGRPMSAPQTVQQTTQQRNIPLTQSTRSAPAMPSARSVPSVSSAQAVRAAQPVSPMMPMPRQRSTAQPLPQNRMQNPLRDPKAPLTVERLHTPTHEVPRASDHAMLFSDVLHRAQDSGLTFAPRQGQGGVPASAQTRAAYTTQALRQAKAEQQAAEARSAPAWQRTALKEASQTPSGAAGASWRFDETARNGDAVGAMAAMAAPRYPEAELNFVQESAPQEGAEMPISTVQHPGAETLRGVQEASAKALTETVRAALKEAAPLMTAPTATPAARNTQSAQNTQSAPAGNAGQTVARPGQSKAAQQEMQKQAEQTAARTVQSAPAATAVRPARTERSAQISGHPGQQTEPQQGGQMAAPASQSVTTSQFQQADQSTGTPQADRNIPPRSNSMVENQAKENRAERIKSAENAGKAAEMPAETAAEHAAGTTETPAVKSEKQSGKTANRQTETSAGGVDAEHPRMPEYAGEHIPALTGDRAFAQTPEEAENFVSRMAAPRYPEAELNFVQEAAPQGGQMAAPVSQSGTVPQARQADQSTGTSRTQQVERNIPPRSNSMVENRAESVKNAENAGKAAEMPAGTAAEHAAGTAETLARNRIPALTGDRAFAQTPEEAADILRRMAAPRYPEAELNFVQEAAPQEGAEMPISTVQHPNAESIRAVQEANAKALTETVRAALKEAAPLMTAPAATTAARNAWSAQNAQAMQTTPAGNAGQTVAHSGQSKAALQEMQKQAEQAAREMAAQTLSETAARQTMQTAQTRTAQPGEKERLRAGHPAFRQETAEAVREFAGTVESGTSAPQTGSMLPGKPGAAYPLDEVETRLPPLSGGQTIPGQLTGQNAGQMPGQLPGQAGGMERAVELLRQNGYGVPQLEYRMEDAGPEVPQMPQTPELSQQAGAAAEKSLLWLGEKVAANAARELSRMQRTMQNQSIRSGSAHSAGSAVQRDQKAQPGGISPVRQMNLKSQPGSASTSGQMSQKGPSGSVSTAGQWNRQGRPGQPGNAGSTGSAGNLADMQSAGNRSQPGGAFQTVSHPASQRADWMGYRPIDMAHPAAHTPGWTAARPMGIPAEAQWRPGGQAAPAMVSPAEMPHLMYQTGQTEDGEAPFAPAGSSARPAPPQLGTSLEAQSAYPALSMEYSSPMSRMEQQLQSAVAQQMSAASRPMGMQTEAGQYMAGKAAPGGMTTLDQMSAPPVNDQIVWQNPYLRSAPADMTYRNKKRPPEQPQPAPRPQTVRMSDAEIHRMADQVFRIVKDKIRQERRKMGL